MPNDPATPARAKVGVPLILNPRYAGATPEMVARALLRHEPAADDGEEEAEPSSIMNQSRVRSSI